MSDPASISPVTGEAWQALARAKIFFAHMSVGYNILDGISDIAAPSEALWLRVVETREPAEIVPGVIAHAQLGHNGGPLAKIASFENLMQSVAPARPDLALMKFCYVDFRAGADIQSVFDRYSRAVEALRIRHPQTIFMHVTVPLRAPVRTFKQYVKGLVRGILNKPGVADDNAAREDFSNLIRKSFDPDRILDLARVESTTPHGRQHCVTRGARRIPMLCPAYTDCGGHLNTDGRIRTAEQLLLAMARVLARR